VAYITLVAPAEIVLFIERQLSDEGAHAAGRHLALAIDITNVMQTVRPPTCALCDRSSPIRFTTFLLLIIDLSLSFSDTMVKSEVEPFSEDNDARK